MAILNTTELCGKTQVSRRTIQRWAKEGSITPVAKNQPGNRWNWEQVRDWLVATGRWDEVAEVALRLIISPMRYCIRDHEMLDANVYVDGEGKRRCRACIRFRQRRARLAKNAA